VRVRLKAWAHHPLAQVLGVYVVVRLGLLVADVLAAHVTYSGHLEGPLRAWDGNHYLNLAENGYPAELPKVDGRLTYSSAGFEPVYPLLVRIVAGTGLSFNVAALIVSLVGGAAAAVLVFKLAAAVVDETVAALRSSSACCPGWARPGAPSTPSASGWHSARVACCSLRAASG
jgi:hypothetical protein